MASKKGTYSPIKNRSDMALHVYALGAPRVPSKRKGTGTRSAARRHAIREWA